MLLAAVHFSASLRDLGLIFMSAAIIGPVCFGVGWLMARGRR